MLADLICWLEANAPVTERFVLVHGAYRTGNLLIDDDRVSAVLDWETEVIGDPMYDVAYVLSDAQPGGHRAAVEPRRARRVLPSLRGGHRASRSTTRPAATTSCCTPCARRRSG